MSFLAGAAAGAAATHLFDPDRGRSRRAALKDQAAGTMRRRKRKMERSLRHVKSDARGRVARVTHLRMSNRDPDDRTLADRVMSEVLSDPAVPKGKVTIGVEEGVVVLRGQLPTRDEIVRVEECVKEVPGVREVRSFLHEPGTPAPNVEAALGASAPRGSGRTGYSGNATPGDSPSVYAT